ncbi:Hypothetical protein SCV20265_3119 [Pseudomonas aeruginosa SCV20265]|nr:Hypothetical protein SCV20265_3119 [Pseudomonas aeruginosa SCV20265]
MGSVSEAGSVGGRSQVGAAGDMLERYDQAIPFPVAAQRQTGLFDEPM